MKTLLRLLVVLIFALAISVLGAYFFLPTYVAKAVVADKGMASKIIPVDVKQSINQAVDKIPAVIEEEDLGITIEDIIEVMEKMTVKEITTTIDILDNTNLKDEQQVIDILRQNINWYQLDTERTRKVVRENLKMSDVSKTLKMIRENGKPYALTIPVAKETIKSVLIEKRKKVEQKLNQPS